VARVADLPQRGGLCVRVGEIEVGLYRVDGEVFAMENPCPHAGHRLSEGTLDGAVIVCPAHGWDFDVRTGFRPADADGWPIPCFAVRLSGDEIWIDVENPINLPRRSASR
jgi:nitrite reductase/ring-hydroxylating ferredoxin subunit